MIFKANFNQVDPKRMTLFTRSDKLLLLSLTFFYLIWLLLVLLLGLGDAEFNQHSLLYILIAQYVFLNSTHSFFGFSLAHRSTAFRNVIDSVRRFRLIAFLILILSSLLIFSIQYTVIDHFVRSHAIRFLYFSTLVWHAIKQTQGISLILQNNQSTERRQLLNRGCYFLIFGCIAYSDNIVYISQGQDLIPYYLEMIGLVSLFISLILNLSYLFQLYVNQEYNSLIFSIRILGYYLFLNPLLGLAMRCLHGIEAFIFYNRFARATYQNMSDLKIFYWETAVSISAVTTIVFVSYFMQNWDLLYFMLTAGMVFNFLHFLQETYFYRLSESRNSPIKNTIYPRQVSHL